MSDQAENIKFQELEIENACVVCFKTTFIYSIGSCNHAYCYECSARMRCLCLQNECPICRQDLPKVIFTKTVGPYATLDRELRSGLYEKKYRIAFADLDIQKAFYRLLEHRCSECDHTPFIEFNKLKEHVRKIHEYFFCEICTDNLKIFSSERRCYSRQQLATHRRIGDANDKSHKGHPRCEYCELRFLDKDELFRHLRREHYFCHLCDADGVNLFYGAINEMRDHFKSEHFLCEEEDCADEQFTAVFRSEIDLRAHVAITHCKNLSRLANKQARAIDLEFSYGPRGRGGGGQEHSRGNRVRTNDTQREFDQIPEQTIVQQAPIHIDSKNDEQFPSLGPSGKGSSVQLANTVRHISYGTAGLARTKENFPALGGGLAPENSKYQNKPQAGGKSKMPTASSMLKGPSKTKSSNRSGASTSSSTSVNKDFGDFPALSQPTSNNNRSVPMPDFRALSKTSTSIRPSAQAPKKDASDFPALSQSSSKKNRNKNDLMEDMILPTTSVNKNLVSSKHRGLVEDNYVSMAAQVSKVQTVQQKDITPAEEIVKKNVPKLNSIDNFPTLGAGSASGISDAPQWLTVKSNQRQQPKQEVNDMPKNLAKNTRKVNEVPAKNAVKTPNHAPNGIKKNVDNKKPGIEKEKSKPSSKPSNGNKENKNENVLVEHNFPSLGSSPTPPTPPPGFVRKPPPGFNSVSSTSQKTSDSDSNGDYTYLAPTNASKRNQALVSEFQKALTSTEAMQEFRHVSQMFRDGNYFPRSYYETCHHVLGAGFETIFPELLVLLPDIEKQQSLYVIHLETKRQSDSSGAKTKKKNKSKELEVCATCKQVLLSNDLIQHVQSHTLANNFPVLNASDEASAVKQWKK